MPNPSMTRSTPNSFKKTSIVSFVNGEPLTQRRRTPGTNSSLDLPANIDVTAMMRLTCVVPVFATVSQNLDALNLPTITKQQPAATVPKIE